MRARIVISLCLACAMAGCSGLLLGPSPTPPAPTPVAVTVAPTVTPTPTRSPQPMITTLTLWLPEELSPYGQQPGAGVLSQHLASFSDAYPDLRVEVIVKKAHGRGGLLDFLRTARDAAPSVLPDLVVLDAADLETAAASGLIQPMDDLLSPATASNRFGFARDMGDIDGKMMGFILGVDLQHSVYRPEMFVDPPLRWTSVVSAPAGLLFAAGGRERQVNEATLMQYLAAGGTLADDEGKPTLDREPMVSVFTFYSNCISSGVISPALVLSITDADQAWEAFQAGQGSMAVVHAGRHWLQPMPTATEGTTVTVTSAAAPIPTADGQPFALVTGGWVITMVAEDQASQGRAMLLLDWLIAPDHNAQWTQAAGYMPSTQSALLLWTVPDTDRATLLGMLDAARPAPSADLMATAGQVLQEALEALLRGRATPRQAANLAIESLGR